MVLALYMHNLYPPGPDKEDMQDRPCQTTPIECIGPQRQLQSLFPVNLLKDSFLRVPV